MHTGIDLALEDRLGSLDGQCGHLLAQRLARLGGLLLGFSLGGGDDLRALASSTIDCASRSASARRCAASVRAAASCSSTRLLAVDSSALALSAADKPSAIFFARSSSAAVIGGQMNFIVNQTRIRNTII